MSARGGIDGFVRRLSWRFRAWTLGLTLAGHGLLVATVLLLVDLLPGGWRRTVSLPVWLAAGLWLAGVTVFALLRLRVPISRADRELGLQDRLLTWVALDRERRAQAAGTWLGDDLDRRLRGLPPERVQVLVRRPLGALRYLVPLLVVLLLLRAFAPLQPPRLPEPEAPLPLAAAPDPARTGEEPAEDEPPQTPPPLTRPQPSPPPPPPPQLDEPPRPILQLPPRDEFTIPQFVGDGPRRRELARLAELEAGAGGGNATPPPAGGATGNAPRPPDPDVDFRRAAEEALRARHVPPHERPFVQRYFEVAARALERARQGK